MYHKPLLQFKKVPVNLRKGKLTHFMIKTGFREQSINAKRLAKQLDPPNKGKSHFSEIL